MCDDGGQEFLFFTLRYAEMIQSAADFDSDFIELLKRDVQVLMRFMHVPAGVLERPAGRLADPEGPHELKALQLALGVPILQFRVHIEFRICDDLVAEAVNDHGYSVDTAQPFIEALLWHVDSPSIFGSIRCGAYVRFPPGLGYLQESLAPIGAPA